jgi:hypothetical protein
MLQKTWALHKKSISIVLENLWKFMNIFSAFSVIILNVKHNEDNCKVLWWKWRYMIYDLKGDLILYLFLLVMWNKSLATFGYNKLNLFKKR